MRIFWYFARGIGTAFGLLLATLSTATAQTAPLVPASNQSILHLSETVQRDIPRDLMRAMLERFVAALPPGGPVRIASLGSGVAAELIEPGIEIDAVAAQSAFGEHGRNFGRLPTSTQPVRIDNHAGQPRRQRQRAKAFALPRDPAIAVDGAQFAQQGSRLLQRGRRR